MARLVGLQGRIRGRLGNTVFYGGKGGESFARVYVPKPKNPDTVRQRVSRKLFSMSRELVQELAATSVLTATNTSRGRALGNLIKKDIISYFSNANTFGYKYDFDKLGEAFNSSDIPVGAFRTPRFDTDLTVVVPLGEFPDYRPYFEDGSQIGVVVLVVPAEEAINALPCRSSVTVLTDDVTQASVLMPASSSGVEYHVYAAVKEVLPSGNGYPAAAAPLRYPSKMSKFVYLGKGTVE